MANNFAELNLSKPLLNALADLEFVQPTPVQEQCFPVIMSGRDVAGIAQTGTGKTFAYLLPLLRQLTHSEQKHPRALILVPTRELVQQVTGEIEKLAKYMSGLRYGGIYGGGNINTQKELVARGLDILVSTPGRIIDLATSGALRLKQIQKLVIDEVDEMLNEGFRSQLELILLDLLPQRRQNVLFSATLTEDVEALLTKFFNDPVRIEIAAHGTPLEMITQRCYHVPNFNTKANLLSYLLQHDASMVRVLVFTGTIKMADRLFEAMQPSGEKCAVMHSRKSQPQRFAALGQFEKGMIRVLIATDVAARGIDISGVTHVINFNTPEAPEDYIHRIGRTGRAGSTGTAIAFVNEVEEAYQATIEALMGRPIPELDLPDEVEVSSVFAEDELPKVQMKNYLKAPPKPKGAFHEKKEKNKKVQLGGPTKRHGLKSRSVNRAVKRNRSKK